jgi:hypothetical protein
MPKRSRLASGLQMVRYSNAWDLHKIESEYRRWFGIRMLTVFNNEMFSLFLLKLHSLQQNYENT